MARILTHPGEVLREEFMKPLGLSANALALALRVPAARISTVDQEEGVDARNKSAHDRFRAEQGPAISRDVQPP